MRALLYLTLCAVIISCSPARKLGLKKSFESAEKNFQHHSGFVLYDPEKKETIYDFNGNRYFTPASNTKIFTFYTSLRLIGDSVPALKYVVRNDSLIFWGTGDPSLLYKFTFNNSRVYDFLKNAKQNLYLSTSNFHSPHFGPGWGWDDYNDVYSAERSPFPVFGNIFTVKRVGSLLTVQPPYFEKFLNIGERKEKEAITRSVHANDFEFHPGLTQPKKKEWDVPMRIDQQLICDLLSDTLDRKVVAVHTPQPAITQPIYSIPTDSLYSVMMQESDNFIAEQLLFICSDIVRDTLQSEIAIKYSIKNFLNDLPDKPMWVDGSGLSRYNLFTPRSIVKLWEKIHNAVPEDRLFSLLATGGKKGTIKKWYKADKPYIFGKTGTLSNNHCLSGFLVTKSGKTLIFAFMNNNYIATTNAIRTNMQDILYTIYEKY